MIFKLKKKHKKFLWTLLVITASLALLATSFLPTISFLLNKE